MTLHARVLLPYGLVAEIEVADEDRTPFVPPPVSPPEPHSSYCNCVACLMTRIKTRETTK
jgi:hypothetical protein